MEYPLRWCILSLVGKDLTDSDLVLRAQAGDRAAFGALVERHQARVVAACLRLSENPPEAKDLAHEALVQAWLELPQLRVPDRFGAWLRIITLNVFRMRYRRRRDEVRLPEDLPADPPTDRSIERAVSRALFRLSPAHRVPLVLHHLEGLSTQEVAAILDVPRGTVLSRLHRGRKAIEDMVREEWEERVAVRDPDLRDDVMAELEVLVELFRDRPQAAERLSVVLERSPERLRQLLSRDDASDVVERIGELLPRLGGGAIRTVLDVRLAARAPEAARAGRALGVAAARYRTLPWAGGPDASASPLAYVLVDAIVAHPAAQAAKAELLLALLAAARDSAVSDLLADALLSMGEPAVGALLARYEEAGDELPRPRALLHALCRTGSALARAAGDDLATGDPARAARGLAAAAALGRHLRPVADLPLSAAGRSLMARHIHAIPADEVDAAALRRLRERVGRYLDAAEPGTREAALVAAAALRDRERVARVRAALEAECTCTRLAAIRAVAALDDAESVGGLSTRLGAVEREERLAALAALGHLGPAAFGARDAVLACLDDPDEGVQVGSVGTLAALGGDELEAVLRRLAASGSPARRKAALRALYRGPPPSQERSELSRRVRERLRGRGAEPVAEISVEAALRFALTDLRPYEERELSWRIGQVCEDVSSVRRALVEQGLMTREDALYRFTPLGEAMWRVERFIEGAATAWRTRGGT